MDETEKRTKAWVGDAVLALFAREWILDQEAIEPGNRIEVFTSLTSNQFLACIGELLVCLGLVAWLVQLRFRG